MTAQAATDGLLLRCSFIESVVSEPCGDVAGIQNTLGLLCDEQQLDALLGVYKRTKVVGEHLYAIKFSPYTGAAIPTGEVHKVV